MLSPVIPGHAVDWRRPQHSPRRILIEQLQGLLHGSFQLRVAPPYHFIRSVFDLDVRSYALVFYSPLASQVIECEARSSDAAAVNGCRNTKRADQPAPGACADKRSKLSQSEVVRQGIAARACRFVYDHDLGTIDTGRGRCGGLAVTHREISEQLAVKLVDNVIGHHPALIISLI